MAHGFLPKLKSHGKKDFKKDLQLLLSTTEV